MRSSRTLATLALLLSSGAALAQTPPPDKQRCADAYTQAQILRTKDKLVSARAKLEVCVNEACPQALRRDCVPWLAEVKQNMPSLAVDVVDEHGQALATAHVTVDGNAIASGQPVELDPGSHTVQADAPGMLAATQTIELARGDKRRAPLALQPQAAVDLPPAAHRPVPVVPIVLASVGAVGLGAFIGFGIAGNSKRGELDASGCKPNCNASDVDTIKTDYIIADVSLAIGIASLATATVLFVVGATSSPPKKDTTTAAALSWSATPLASGGGLVGVAGRF